MAETVYSMKKYSTDSGVNSLKEWLLHYCFELTRKTFV